MRKSLQIYLKQIFADTEWEERDVSDMPEVKTQLVSSLLNKKQVKDAMAIIAAKKETIGLNLDFDVFSSRSSPDQYRVVCNLKKELNAKNLHEITDFLNTVYGSLENKSIPKRFTCWSVEKSRSGYLITIYSQSSYVTPMMLQNGSSGCPVKKFVFGTDSVITDTDHPCKARVMELANTGVETEIHKYETIYYWNKESLHELYTLMLQHRKTATYSARNISCEVAEAALRDIDRLPPEMRYQVGFFLNLADAGVLAQVKNDSQNALREAKVSCENEEQASLNMQG